MHAFHEGLAGFDPGNVLHDGCEECEEHAADPLNGLTKLDMLSFRQAFSDMIRTKWDGEGLGRNVSWCDSRLMNALYTVMVLAERHVGIGPYAVLSQIDHEVAAMQKRHRVSGLSL